MANWFVAIPVDPGGWFERVTSAPAGVRLFGASDLHLTVAFLGSVGEAAARRAFEHARALPLAPQAVMLGPVLPMGNPRRFSALSARLEGGHDAVAGAIEAVRDGVCDAAGARRETRPALPHLTLARPIRRATSRERGEALRWAAALDLGTPEVALRAVALYTWAPDRRERLFTIVERSLLG